MSRRLIVPDWLALEDAHALQLYWELYWEDPALTELVEVDMIDCSVLPPPPPTDDGTYL